MAKGQRNLAPVTRVQVTNLPDPSVTAQEVQDILSGGVPVELQAPGTNAQSDFRDTWDALDNTAVSFADFQDFINLVINGTPSGSVAPLNLGPASLLFNSQAYNLLKFAVNQFVRSNMGFPPDAATLPGASTAGVLPYYEIILRQLNEFNTSIANRNSGNAELRTRLRGNRSELIWNYWHEEGMLVQTMNAIALRFQNVSAGVNDPLGSFEVDTLRPLANILFGYIQDAPNRLNINRRNYEYLYQYGIGVSGNAVYPANPVSTRANFIQAFHNLLYKCHEFYKLVDDLTKNADAFPVLNALQEVNLLLTEGMHNQYNDLSLAARAEMMLEQWILSRREIQEFLRGKPMIAYREPWMGAVDHMKTLQGWPSTSVKFYHDLAITGEEILLSIRFVPWNSLGTAMDARVWALEQRENIQRYAHNYEVVTSADITAEPGNSYSNAKYIMPSILLQQKYKKERLLKNR